MSVDEQAIRMAVIGAGLSGLACARSLKEAGCQVTVVEKSGDIGGRLAARRRGGGVWHHGAPAVSARSTAFRQFLTTQIGSGFARSLSASTREIVAAGRPDMRELPRALAQGLDLRFGLEVTRLQRTGDCWHLHTGEGTIVGPFDGVLTTIPAPQLWRLLQRSGLELPSGLADVVMAPRWTLLVGFEQSPPRWQPTDHRLDGFETMPVRPSAQLPDCFVIHASADWSRRHLELSRAEAASRLTRLMAEDPQARTWLRGAALVKAHRWRYALTEVPLGAAFHFDDGQRFGFTGDWCSGDTAEAAYLNGLALTEAVLQAVPGCRLSEARAEAHG